ncbi:hypothetical protein C9439_08025 [archaeon SCG-AAA382B04]|nr:hypothetical protein C9439_08025 [archaeon SCG-AAA382B04]
MKEILLVDDEPDFLDLCKSHLEQNENLDVEVVSSSKKAYEYIKNNSYDCIVSDYQMPSNSGLELLEKVRKKLNKDTPFIVFTGKGREEVAMRALNLGADRYIQKGGDPKTQFSVLSQATKQEVEHWRTKRKLDKSEKEKSLILENSPNHVLFQDLNHEIVWANKKAAESVDMEPSDLVGQKCYEIWHNRKKPCDICPVEESWKAGEVERDEVKSPDGRHWLITGAPAKNHKGKITGAVEITINITERKESEDRKEFLNSLVRHNVKNKIQVAEGYLNLLQEKELQEEEERYIQRSLKALRKSEKVTDKVKTLLDVEEIELRKRDINKILDNAISEVKDLAEKRGFELKTEIEEKEVVACDLCEKVFSNLIENSIKHSGGDKVKIVAKEKKDNFVVSIRDNGKGIPDENKDKIFEKGFSSDGTGLGLYLVKEIVETNEGKIEVKESDLGGARFDVYLNKA